MQKLRKKVGKMAMASCRAGHGDVEKIEDWPSKFTLEGLKGYAESRDYSGFALGRYRIHTCPLQLPWNFERFNFSRSETSNFSKNRSPVLASGFVPPSSVPDSGCPADIDLVVLSSAQQTKRMNT